MSDVLRTQFINSFAASAKAKAIVGNTKASKLSTKQKTQLLDIGYGIAQGIELAYSAQADLMKDISSAVSRINKGA